MIYLNSQPSALRIPLDKENVASNAGPSTPKRMGIHQKDVEISPFKNHRLVSVQQVTPPFVVLIGIMIMISCPDASPTAYYRACTALIALFVDFGLSL
jgi:hypothetical protein